MLVSIPNFGKSKKNNKIQEHLVCIFWSFRLCFKTECPVSVHTLHNTVHTEKSHLTVLERVSPRRPDMMDDSAPAHEISEFG